MKIKYLSLLIIWRAAEPQKTKIGININKDSLIDGYGNVISSENNGGMSHIINGVIAETPKH